MIFGFSYLLFSSLLMSFSFACCLSLPANNDQQTLDLLTIVKKIERDRANYFPYQKPRSNDKKPEHTLCILCSACVFFFFSSFIVSLILFLLKQIEFRAFRAVHCCWFKSFISRMFRFFFVISSKFCLLFHVGSVSVTKLHSTDMGKYQRQTAFTKSFRFGICSRRKSN